MIHVEAAVPATFTLGGFAIWDQPLGYKDLDLMSDVSISSSSKKNSPAHSPYRPHIDGLRAVAVILVVAFHAFPTWIQGGFVGVDIFFVISGFLISSIILKSLSEGSFSFSEFYARRIKRIFPALILVMSFCFFFGWFTLLPDEYKQFGKHAAAGAGFVSNFFFWQEAGYFDSAADTKPLLHLWSLAVEEQFYLVWPLLLFLAWKRRHVDVLLLALVILAFSFSANAGIHRNNPVQAFYSPWTRFWELMAGSVLACQGMRKIQAGDQSIPASFKLINISSSNARSWFGILLIGAAVLLINKDRAFPGWWALLPTIGAYLILSAGPDAWLNRTLLSHRILVWFGLISYPLYLWHWPLLSFAHIILGGLTREVRIAIVLISILLARLTYLLIEKPIRFGKPGGTKTIALFGLLLVVGSAGYAGFANDGFGFRFPKLIQDLAQSNSRDKKGSDGACFLSPEQDYTAFKACEPQPSGNKKPTLLLWGDSNAAQLYAGYKAAFGEKFNIVVRTASSCPPILDMELKARPHCKEINDNTLEFIKKEKPNKIVLAAIWSDYDWRKIETTIARLQDMRIMDIDLIGPVPQWNENLPREIVLMSKIDEFHNIPFKTKFGLKTAVFEVASQMSALSSRLGINFLAPTNYLCDEAGCLIRFGNTHDTLTSFDTHHLTEMGSIYLVSKFPGK